MDVSVIIVSYNTKALTAKAVESVIKLTKKVNYEIIVVDNNSKDGSQKYLKSKFPQIVLIENKDNLGFAKANNQGIDIARGKYVFLLNSDAYIIENSLEKLLRRASGKEVLSPAILNEDNSIQQSVGFFPNLPQVFYWMSFLDDLPGGTVLKPYHVDHDSFYKKEKEIDWATGAALFVPMEIIKKAGPLDSEIFMYGEDVEWCYRIKKNNFKIIYTPITKVIHLQSASSGKVSKNAYVGEYAGILYFYKKYKSSFSLQIARLLLKIGALGRILIFGLLKGKEFAKIYAEALKVV